VSAPLVINLKDGSVWERRAMTAAGVALYALAGSCGCPEYLMASESELAAQGIAGSADVLPVPVGPKPQVDDRAKAPWGRGEDGRPLLPMGADWTDVPELVDRTVAGIQSRVDEAPSGHWYLAPAEMGLAPGTVHTRVDGYQRTVGQFTNVLPAGLELVLHAHDDLSWCLEMLAKLRARVAELEEQREADHKTWQHDLRTARDEREATAVRIVGLEAERHITNEALDDAVKALRARREDEPAEPYVSRLLPPRDAVCARPCCGHRGEDHHHGDTKCWANLPRTRQPNGAWGAVQICYCEGFVAAPAVEVSADRLTAFFAPTQALREDAYDGPLRDSYLISRDLPETGGVS